MKPQSGQRLEPYEHDGVSQVIILNGVEYGKGATVKMRWKVSYKIGTESVHEQGEISSLGVP
jgi:ADP-ribosylation factor-binding protein GGA